ncbi:2,4'-dihydroxyacetophenone dioxygenase family protein [Streptomyces sp. F63]|uniref:2,4'-dihydroxyacetophenone dioxygenase family protein n=1 Tax=Streptomyces sp. F63 TaxID=2824887 RepID=UPI001B37BE56|nr:2,4'-dihydroxyacetophenone dioxygenase family protein [Streptomyces sp. F63]MBQ0985990.1 2,4'-dihydroxyacetophenone dioxygenase family protein [Streptomyces sp. F63]
MSPTDLTTSPETDAETSSLERTILRYSVPDHALDAEDIPWVEYVEGVHYKPFRFDVVNSSFILLLKIDTAGVVNRHQHTGQVKGYTIRGEWHYPERTWRATPGTFVFEAPGDVHTLVCDSGDGMLTLFDIQGTLRFLDDDDQVVAEHDVFFFLDQYLAHCERAGITPVDLVY